MMDADGQIDTHQRNLMMSARNIKKKWPTTCPQEIKNCCEKEPDKPFKIRHILMPVEDMYGDDKAMKRKFGRNPFVSLYVACEHNALLGQAACRCSTMSSRAGGHCRTCRSGFRRQRSTAWPTVGCCRKWRASSWSRGKRPSTRRRSALVMSSRTTSTLYAGGFTMVDLDGQKLQDVMQDLNESGNVQFGR
jgi:hypothetical protein